MFKPSLTHTALKRTPQEMEASGQVDPGAIARLRRESKASKKGSYKQVQMLAQALSPAVSLDEFAPQQKPLLDGIPPLDALMHKPTLIICCDEERKQFLGCICIVPFSYWLTLLRHCLKAPLITSFGAWYARIYL